MLTILTNAMSNRAARHGRVASRSLSDSFRKLSSGNRIERAADDAAGLAVSENLNTRSQSQRMASRNAHDGISIVQTMEGGVEEVSELLKRMRELAVQSSSESLANTERTYLNDEFKQLQSEIGRIKSTTQFNGTALLDGSWSEGKQVQVGANNSAQDRIAIEMGDVSQSAGVETDVVWGDPQNVTITGNSLAASGGLNNAWDNAAAGQNALTGDGYVQVTASQANKSQMFGLSYVPNGPNEGGSTQYRRMDYTIDMEFTGKVGVWEDNVHLGYKLGSYATGDEFRIVQKENTISYQHKPIGGEFSTFYTSTVASSGADLYADAAMYHISGNTIDNAKITSFGDLTDNASLNVSTVSDARAALGTLDSGLTTMNGYRSRLGATQNRLVSALNNLDTDTESLDVARSRIRDADFAFETAQMAKAQAMQSASTAVLAQTNGLPQMALRLIG